MSQKLKDTGQKEQLVVEKYFKLESSAEDWPNKRGTEHIIKTNEEMGQDGAADQDGDKFGSFIDYYIKQSENYGYVTNSMGKFERDLLEHVKRIKDGSVLLNPHRGSL